MSLWGFAAALVSPPAASVWLISLCVDKLMGLGG